MISLKFRGGIQLQVATYVNKTLAQGQWFKDLTFRECDILAIICNCGNYLQLRFFRGEII